MGESRKRHSGGFKAQVAIAAIRGDRTLSELSSEYGVHANVISKWKKHVLEQLPRFLSGRGAPAERDQEELISRLYQEIGQLKVELDWLKKKSGLGH
jgi:putative transposase